MNKSELQEAITDAVHVAVVDALAQFGGAQKPTESKKWLTNDEVIQYLGLSVPTLARYRRDGKLPYSRVGGRVYYKRVDVDALLSRNMVS